MAFIAHPMVLYTINLFVLLATGVWVSLWVHHNSEWFPLIGGLLGLGSFFAWIAFITNLLSDDRKKSYQEIFEKRFLENGWACLLLLLVNAGLIYTLPFSNGGLRLINASDASSLSVQVVAPPARGTASAAPIFIGRQQDNKNFFPADFGGNSHYVLSVSNAPSIRVTVKPFSRRTVLLPAAAWQQLLILIRPATATDAGRFQDPGNTYYLKIELCTGPADSPDCASLQVGSTEVIKYSGAALLVGTDRDVIVPTQVSHRWRSDGWSNRNIELWSRPIAIDVALSDTITGIRIEVLDDQKSVLCAKSSPVPKNFDNLVQIGVERKC